jgi:hypothetical protein
MIRLLYVLLGLVHRWFHPYRLMKWDGGLVYIARDAVWYIGPKGEKRRLDEDDA